MKLQQNQRRGMESNQVLISIVIAAILLAILRYVLWPLIKWVLGILGY